MSAERRRNGCFAFAAGATLLLVLPFLLRAPLLRAAAGFLTLDDAGNPADAIVLLNGEENTRPLHAAQLYQQGRAPRVVIARAADPPALALLQVNTTDLATALLQMNGVPRAAIVELRTPRGVSSTADEALAVRAWAARTSADSLLLVTSDFHGRRARWIFRRLTDAEIAVSTTPHYAFDESNWWQHEGGLLTYIEEYLKFARYVVRY